MNHVKCTDNFADISNLRLSAWEILSREIEHFLAYQLVENGVAYILDSRGLLEGMTSSDIREAIDNTLLQREALESEASQGQGSKAERATVVKRNKNKHAAISFERIVSPKTGKKGWRINWKA